MSSRAFLPVPDPRVVSADVVDAMQTLIPNWLADASDPGVYWADQVGKREEQNARDYNTAAFATYILTATGPDLDRRLTDVGLEPQPGESDDSKRRRYFDVWTALTDATPEWAIFIGRQRLPTIGDASLQLAITGFNADNVIPVTVYGIDQDGEPLTTEDTATFQRALRDRTAIYLLYTVNTAIKVEYTVTGTVTYRRGAPNPEQYSKASLNEKMVQLRKLDTAVTLNALRAAIFIDNDSDVVDCSITVAKPTPKLISTVYHGSIPYDEDDPTNITKNLVYIEEAA